MDKMLDLWEHIHGKIDYVAGIVHTDPIFIYAAILIVLVLLLYLIDCLGKGQATWGIQRIQQMDDQKFETLIADLWEKMDYRTQQTPPGRDEGIDVIASKPRFHGLLGTKRLAIQAKRYGADHKVDVNTVMQYASVPLRHRQYNAVIVVTSSGFTEPASEAGRKMETIESLIDGRELATLLNKHRVWSSDPFWIKTIQWIARITIWTLILIVGLALSVWLYSS